MFYVFIGLHWCSFRSREKSDVGDINSPMGGKLHVELGEALRRFGDLERAQAAVEEGIKILQITSTFDSHKGAEAMRELGAIKREIGNLSGARADLFKACSLLEQTKSSDTIGGLKTLIEKALLEKAPAAMKTIAQAQALHTRICPRASDSRLAMRMEQIYSEYSHTKLREMATIWFCWGW